MEKKEEEPAKAEGEMFKLKKKSSVTPRKQIPKEEDETVTLRRGEEGMLQAAEKVHTAQGQPQPYLELL